MVIQHIQILVAALMIPTLIKLSIYPAEVLKATTEYLEVAI